MILVSVRTMSWSFKPGIDVHLLTSVGLLVMKMSSVFSKHVGKVTCSAQMSFTTLTKTVLIGTVNSEIFARVLLRETSHMRSFVKTKSSKNGEITLSFTDIVKSCPSRDFLASQICYLTLFAKIDPPETPLKWCQQTIR